MRRLHRRTMAFLILGLVAAGGLGIYLIERLNRLPAVPDESTQRPAPAGAEQDESARHLAPIVRDDPVRRPFPVVFEVRADFPGASAEEVERQVTIPLEITLAGIPQMEPLRTTSIPGTSMLYVSCKPSADAQAVRQAIIDRLNIAQALPPGVDTQLSRWPSGLALRYLLVGPHDESGRSIYTLHDLRELQDWVLEREFRRLPGVIDVVSSGGGVKRYEIHPDPERLRRYGITLQQLAAAVKNSNASADVGDGVLSSVPANNIRNAGLLGRGADPLMAQGLKATDPKRQRAFFVKRKTLAYARSGRSSSPRSMKSLSWLKTWSMAGGFRWAIL